MHFCTKLHVEAKSARSDAHTTPRPPGVHNDAKVHNRTRHRPSKVILTTGRRPFCTCAKKCMFRCANRLRLEAGRCACEKMCNGRRPFRVTSAQLLAGKLQGCRSVLCFGFGDFEFEFDLEFFGRTSDKRKGRSSIG